MVTWHPAQHGSGQVSCPLWYTKWNVYNLSGSSSSQNALIVLDQHEAPLIRLFTSKQQLAVQIRKNLLHTMLL